MIQRDQFLAQVVHQSTLPIAIKDRRGRFVYANRAFGALVGAKAESLLGLTDQDVFTEPCAQQLLANDEQVAVRCEESVRTEELARIETENRERCTVTRTPLFDAAGRVTHVALRVAPVRAAGESGESVLSELQGRLGTIVNAVSVLERIGHEIREPGAATALRILGEEAWRLSEALVCLEPLLAPAPDRAPHPDRTAHEGERWERPSSPPAN